MKFWSKILLITFVILHSVVLSPGVLVSTVYAEANFAGGDGTVDNPYQIADWNHLNNVRLNLGAHYVLINNLDAGSAGYATRVKNGEVLANDGLGWEPIGGDGASGWENPFTGSFDGDNKTISNLFINRPAEIAVGLFGYAINNATIKNVGLIDLNVTGGDWVGGLIGYIQDSGSVLDSYVNGLNITGLEFVGGLIGATDGNIIISDSYVTGTGGVFGGEQIGGLIGRTYAGNTVITNVHATVTVTGDEPGDLIADYIGGLIGYNQASVTTAYATGVVKGQFDTGGLIGYNFVSGVLNNVYATGNVIRVGNYPKETDSRAIMGGLVGMNSGEINTAHATGSVTAPDLDIVGGLIGDNDGVLTSVYATGHVTGGDKVGGLIGINNGWLSAAYAAGNVNGVNDIGGLIGVNTSNVTNTYATGSVTATGSRVGGLVGHNLKFAVWADPATITNSYSTGAVSGAVSGAGNVGGLVGSNTESTVGATNFWDVTTSGLDTSAGGAVGKTTAELKTLSTFTVAGWSIETTDSIVYTGFPYPGLRMADDGAVWQLTAYAVTYNANEASGGTVPGGQTKVHDVALTLATNSGNLVRTGHTFAGWNTAANGAGTDYAEGGNYDQDQLITLFAKWIADTIVSYNNMDMTAWLEVTDTQASEFFTTYSIDQINNLNLMALNQLTTKLTPEQYQTHKDNLGVVYTPEKLLTNLALSPISALNILPAALVEDALNHSLSSNELLTLEPVRLAELINDLSINYEAINDALLVAILNSLPNNIITGTINLNKIIEIVNAVSDKSAFNANIQDMVQPAQQPPSDDSGGGGDGGGGTPPPPATTTTAPTAEPTTIIASPVPAEQIAETTETETTIGKETTITTTDGRNIAIIQIAKDKMTDKIQQLINQRPTPTQPATPGTGATQTGTGEQQTRSEQRSQREQNTVEIATSTQNTNTISAQLTGDIVKAMESGEITVAVKTNNIAYIIPAKVIGIDRIAENLNIAVTDLASIVIEVKIDTATTAKTEQIEQRASQRNAEIVIAPVSFQVIAHTTSSTGETNSQLISNFNQYVERVVELPEGIDPTKITTGIIYDDNGTFDHIPTEIYEQAGKWFVRLNSLTNSDYTIIYNPITVESVQGHWSEQNVNDMASRIVIAEHQTFKPNEVITRAEFADYIVRAVGLYRVGSYQQGLYSDINKLNIYRDSITLASQYGIIQGYPDQTFRPEATITREEAMTMYARAMDIVELRETEIDLAARYTDETQISDWAYDYVKKTVSGGVFRGRTATTINPLDTFTKAEAATAIRNMLIKAQLINE